MPGNNQRILSEVPGLIKLPQNNQNPEKERK